MLTHTKAAGATLVAVSNGVVVLAGQEGLRFLDGASLDLIDEVRAATSLAVRPTRYAGARAAFFADYSGGRSVVYAVLNDNRAIQVADYEQRPLLADAVRNKRAYARLTPDRHAMVAYAAGRTTLLRR